MISSGVRILTVATAVALLPAAALAHEGHTHYVMGTIKALDAGHIVVTTTDAKTHAEKTVDITLNAATKFRRGATMTDRSDLRSGERVVVSVGNGKEPLKASEVRVGAATRGGQ